MTPPEPQAMTLEEALMKLAETDHTLAFTDDENEPWVVVEKLEVDIATPYCRSWPEAASFALGYPVVERGPAAELVEAATALMAALDRMPVAYTSGHVNAEKFQYETWPKAVRELRAALAAYEASRK